LYMRKLVAALFAALVIAVVAAGCGGGGDSTGSSSTAETTTTESDSGSSSTESDSGESSAGGPAPTKAVFIKEADAVCTAADTKLSEEVVGFAEDHGIDIEKEEEPSKDQQVEIYEQIVLPNIAKQAEELEALTPPKGDESTVEDLTSTLTSEVEEAEADPSNINTDALEEASKKAQAYGLQTCGG
jgi:hypothetical protein